MTTYKDEHIEIMPYAQPQWLWDIGIRPGATLVMSGAIQVPRGLTAPGDQLALAYIPADARELRQRSSLADTSIKESYACMAALNRGIPQWAMAQIVPAISGDPDGPRKLVEQATASDLERIARTVLPPHPAPRARVPSWQEYPESWEVW
ncbi:hypothetical protein HYU19_03645 [Candidatus Woesearchaeota archaeon]|nr:hypothetical protein [Candidatus Woesearchaeota archaeon]